MAATTETLRLANGLRVQLNRTVDNQTRDLVRAWAAAFDEVAPDLQSALTDLVAAADDGRVTKRMLLRSSRLQKALQAIAHQLDGLAKDAGVRITGDLDDLINRAGKAQTHIIASQLPTEIQAADLVGWDRVSDASINAIVRRSTKAITSRMWPLSRDADRAVRRELVRGISAGSNPRVVASRMVARVEGRFNGGLTRALAIARTEMLDAHRAAALQSLRANADVVTGWSWHCELSTRSCPACISMDGQVFPVATPGPNGHVNCRCTGVPVTKSWSDLGFDLGEPASVLTPARDWFEGLSTTDQRSVLGPTRFDAWKAGTYPPDKWATVRKNDGWRDSVQVSKAPQRGGRRRSSAALAS